MGWEEGRGGQEGSAHHFTSSHSHSAKSRKSFPARECRHVTWCRGVRRKGLVFLRRRSREAAKCVASFLSASRGRRGRRHEQSLLFSCIRPAVNRRLCAHAKPGCGGAAFPRCTINRRVGRGGGEVRGWRRGRWRAAG